MSDRLQHEPELPPSHVAALAIRMDAGGLEADEAVLRRKWRHNRFVRYLVLDPLNLIGVTIVLFAIMLAIVGPIVAPYDPTIPDYNYMGTGPIGPHLFGTDQIGDDIFSRVLAGARLSMGVAAVVLAVAVTIGLTLGSIAGAAGGWLDEIIMRITDMFLAFPVIILALAIAASLGPSLSSSMIALSAVFWPWYARLMRGQVLSIKQKEYVEAAHSLGASRRHIMWRHILPNCLSPIVVEMSLDFGYAILATSSLSFIGLGAQPPSPEWGAMIVAGRDYIRDAWWISTFPGIALTLTVAGFNLLGDGLRDALDPRAVRP
ncbi:MAG TPA: ABC transporter permease [Chloroflexota bacterium]|nr:ABC transporter permease [Chloroflexota bacterium]